MRMALSLSALALAAIASPVAAAAGNFGLEYRVERRDAGRLDIATCLATAQRASARLGFAAMNTQTYPKQLAVFTSGPKSGGGSLIVYCIAVDTKTAYVVQAIDYNNVQSAAAKRAADTVHQALLKASQ